MIRFLVLCFVLGLCGQASARPVLVKSGEHEDFSRLVVYLPRGQEWSLIAESDTTHRFVASGLSDGFNTSEVYEMIPRTRLAEISSDATTLVMELGCDCEVVTQVADSGQIILDLVNVPPMPADVPEPVAVKPEIETSAPPWAAAPRRNLAAEATISEFVQSEPPAPQPELRSELLEQISRAATQTLLDVPKTEIIMPQIKAAEDADLPKEPARPAPSLETPERLRIRTAVDQAAQASNEPYVATPSEQICAQSSDYDIASWGDDLPFGVQIGALRRKITGEFDVVSQEDALALARLYVFFGMGPEARQVLETNDLATPAAQAVGQLAWILDHRADDYGVIKSLQNCPSGPVMWLALAGRSASDMSRAQVGDITATFSALPEHLRSLIGPELIAVFMQDGDKTSAGVIRNALGRKGEMDAGLAVAELAEDSDARRSALRDAIKRSDADSPAAVLELIESQLRAGEFIELSDIEIAGAYAQQLQGQPIAAQLKRAEILALNGNELFAESQAEFLRSRVGIDGRGRSAEPDFPEHGARWPKPSICALGDDTVRSGPAVTSIRKCRSCGH